MKRVFLILLITILCYSCKQQKTSSQTKTDVEVEANTNLDGVWKLASFYNYRDNVVVDTINADPENLQVKVFLDNKVMWSRKVPKGNEEYFGYGAYHITDTTLVEILEYGSEEMLKVLDTNRVFSFELLKSIDTFTQIDIGPEGDRIFSENYIRIKE
jgi:hypothetical protein